MSPHVIAIVVSVVACAAGCLCGPRVIAGLREPAAEGADPSAVPDRPTYAELAARPRLGAKLGVAGAVFGGLVGWQLGWVPVLPAWLYLVVAGVVLGYVDSQTRLLPTRIIAPSYGVLVALLVVAAAGAGDFHRLWGVLFGWLVMGGLYFVLWFIYPKGLGYGDVRLSGLLGLSLGYLGWAELLTGLYSGFLLGGIGGGLLWLVQRRRHGRHYPFGPYMLLGALAGLVWGAQIGQWYTTY